MSNRKMKPKILKQVFLVLLNGFLIFAENFSLIKNRKIMSYTLPALPYAYEALEPYFDKETMTIHHQRHHQAYVDNLNKAIAGTGAENEPLENVLRNISKYSAAVRNNGGGHYNHSLFWETLSATPKKA